MKSVFVLALFAVILAVVTSQLKPCVYTEWDCGGVQCSDGKKAYCHENGCHCHEPTECVFPDHKKCADMCGEGASCDENGHCHGPTCHVE